MVAEHLFTSAVETIVIDEIDTLLEKRAGFQEDLAAILGPIQRRVERGDPVQFLLTGATVGTATANACRKLLGVRMSA